LFGERQPEEGTLFTEESLLAKFLTENLVPESDRDPNYEGVFFDNGKRYKSWKCSPVAE